MMWPPLENRTFRCGRRREIDSYTAGFFRIFFESLVRPLLGEFMKNVCMVEQYHTGTETFRLKICSGLKKNADPAGWATPGDRIFQRIRIYIRKGFRI
jgi:hypothetical protein